MLALDAKTDIVVKAANVRRRGILLTELFGAIIRTAKLMQMMPKHIFWPIIDCSNWSLCKHFLH